MVDFDDLVSSYWLPSVACKSCGARNINTKVNAGAYLRYLGYDQTLALDVAMYSKYAKDIAAMALHHGADPPRLNKVVYEDTVSLIKDTTEPLVFENMLKSGTVLYLHESEMEIFDAIMETLSDRITNNQDPEQPALSFVIPTVVRDDPPQLDEDTAPVYYNILTGNKLVEATDDYEIVVNYEVINLEINHFISLFNFVLNVAYATAAREHDLDPLFAITNTEKSGDALTYGLVDAILIYYQFNPEDAESINNYLLNENVDLPIEEFGNPISQNFTLKEEYQYFLSRTQSHHIANAISKIVEEFKEKYGLIDNDDPESEKRRLSLYRKRRNKWCCRMNILAEIERMFLEKMPLYEKYEHPLPPKDVVEPRITKKQYGDITISYVAEQPRPGLFVPERAQRVIRAGYPTIERGKVERPPAQALYEEVSQLFTKIERYPDLVEYIDYNLKPHGMTVEEIKELFNMAMRLSTSAYISKVYNKILIALTNNITRSERLMYRRTLLGIELGRRRYNEVVRGLKNLMIEDDTEDIIVSAINIDNKFSPQRSELPLHWQEALNNNPVITAKLISAGQVMELMSRLVLLTKSAKQ